MRPFDFAHFWVFERPLSGKADVRRLTGTVLHINARFRVFTQPRPEADVHNHSAGGARRATDPELAQDQATPVNRDEDVAPTRRVIDRHL